MNEYTRREEVRWTLIAAAILVLCIGAALVLLMTAQGKIVPDPAARVAAKQADLAAQQLRPCLATADKLVTEIDLFRTSAKTARLGEAPDAGAKPTGRAKVRKEKEPDVELAWGTAQPSYKQAKALALCRLPIEAAAGARPNAAAGWSAIEQASALAAPAEGDKIAQVQASRALLGLLGEAPIDKVVAEARDAEAALKKAADDATKRADTALVREPLPAGLVPREVAILFGVALSLVALLVSFLSVRGASLRRLATLTPLRKAQQPGFHAAAILKLAAHHNGGEPGLVIGAALGGLIAGGLRSADADLFVVGVMGGLLVGLGVQWGLRIALGTSSWRARAAELGDTEKPAIPIVLVLSGVNLGLEAQFLRFFEGLAPNDAAQTVAKLAMTAEERILAAAEAGAANAAPGGYPPPPGGGYAAR